MHSHPNESKALYTITLITVILLIGFAIFSAMNNSKFFFDAIIGILIVIVCYRYRLSFIYSVPGATLSAAGIVMNTAGAVGAYNLTIGIIGWDKFLHIIAAAGVALITYAYLRKKQAGILLSILGAFLIAQGLGAFNELVEFLGTRYFDIHQGLFGTANGDNPLSTDLERFDAEWDMIFNSIGIIFSIGIAALLDAKNNLNVKNNSKKKVKRRQKSKRS